MTHLSKHPSVMRLIAQLDVTATRDTRLLSGVYPSGSYLKFFPSSFTFLFSVKAQLYVASLWFTETAGPVWGSRSQHKASWLGGRQHRPSVVCVFSLVRCHKTLQPARTPRGAHVRSSVPTEGGRGRRERREGRGSLKHLHSLQAALVLGRKPACLARSRNNSSSVWRTGLDLRFGFCFCFFYRKVT